MDSKEKMDPKMALCRMDRVAWGGFFTEHNTKVRLQEEWSKPQRSRKVDSLGVEWKQRIFKLPTAKRVGMLQ